jgi:propionyl-CoA carboxylase beta chain
MVNDTSYMFITGPDVIKTVTHEDVTKEELGGAATHNRKSGVAHFAADSDEQALRMVRELLSFLPSNNLDDAPRLTSTDEHRNKTEFDCPEASNQPYDIREVIDLIVDEGYFLRHRDYAEHCRRFWAPDGRSVGIVANQPAYLAGVLDAGSSIRRASCASRLLQHSDRDV